MTLEYHATFKECDLVNDLSKIIERYSQLNKKESLDLATRSIEDLKKYNEKQGNSALYKMVLDFAGEIAIKYLQREAVKKARPELKDDEIARLAFKSFDQIKLKKTFLKNK